ncbi:MAG: acyl-phosphate glycerol 3-phosphate acyltransferase [Firmicutes bacterium HGW-Firmicutes-11]|jgi:glycerol-3-phosphate acyltransferase PlsY|nr:MAG: acyl-phosphate glycerol 3-phosphate acyltransferase [Firmicutes bacterium HGW-Firmicutes-11]
MAFDLFIENASLLWIPVLIIAYLIGNISPAILISRAAGIDIRTKGSGNAGTTNMLRVMGKKAALITLVIDVFKGVIAVVIGRAVGGEGLAVLCGLFVFVGHIWPALFEFRGGKGIATGLGLLLAIKPMLGLICLAAAAVGLLLTRRVSVGSLLAAILLPFLGYWLVPDYWFFLLIISIVIFIKHRSNIKRLLKGEEPKFNLKK